MLQKVPPWVSQSVYIGACMVSLFLSVLLVRRPITPTAICQTFLNSNRYLVSVEVQCAFSIYRLLIIEFRIIDQSVGYGVVVGKC